MENINLTAIEDITEFTDDEHIPVEKINLEFQQESKLKGIVREFTIFNDIQCYQMVKKKHAGKHKFRINLTYLDPEPKREFILADSWLITAVISAILGFLFVYTGWFSDMPFNRSAISILSALTISFSFIALLIALLRTRDRVFLYSRYGRAPILEFINKNPDSNAFTDFLGSLRKHIVLAQQRSKLGPTSLLSLELKELRRLKNEGVVSELIYEDAKKRIFSNQAFKSEHVE